MPDFRRLVRGTVKNVLVWGIGWTVLGFGATLVRMMFGQIGAPTSLSGAMVWGFKIGLGGGIAGAAFSAYIAYAYRRRSIQGISWLKFGIGGALATVLSITAFLQGASLLSGSGLIPWRYMQSTTAMFAVFGFCVAAASIKVAQSATARDEDVLDNTPEPPGLPLAGVHETVIHTNRQRQS